MTGAVEEANVLTLRIALGVVSLRTDVVADAWLYSTEETVESAL